MCLTFTWPPIQPDSLQVPYCQAAPRNEELTGFFHCQFAASDFTKFSGDQTGNVPLGLDAVNPLGSCPANTNGPVPDAEELESLVSNSVTPEGASSGTSGSGSAVSNATVSSNSTATGQDLLLVDSNRKN